MRSVDFAFDSGGVVAAPRGHFQVGAPIPVHALTATSIQSGRILQVPPNGKTLTGSEANGLLAKGKADLVLDRVDLSVGNPSARGAEPYRGGFVSPDAPIVAALVARNFASLSVRDSRVSVTLPNGRRERLFNVNLKIKPQGRNAVTAEGTAIWRGQDIKFSIETGTLSEAGLTMPVSLKLEGPLISVRFDGTIDKKDGLQLNGKADLAAPSLRRLARLLGAAWPDGAGLEKVSLSGPVNWTKASLAFPKANVRLDGNVGVGAIAIKSDTAIPQLSGTLAFEQFDMTSYAASNSGRDASAKSIWWDAITSAWSMPLARHFSADLRLSAKQTVFAGHQIGKAAATVSLRNGKFSAQLASLAFEGGSGSGQLTVDFNGLVPRTTMRGKLINAPLGDLASALFGRRSIEGRATITADLHAQGSNFHPMLNDMSGKVNVDLENGGAIGLDLKRFLSTEPGISERLPSALLRGAVQGTTEVDKLDLDIEFKDGHVICRKLEVLFDNRIARVAGEIDLRERQADVRAVVHPEIARSDDGKPVSQEPIQGHRIKLRGPWDSSKVALSKLVGGADEFAAALLPEKDQLHR